MRTELLKKMPPVNGLSTLSKADAFNSDIISCIHANYPEAVKQCKSIAKNFKGSTRLQTSFNIWKWLKSNIQYVKDVKGSQWVKLPNRFISDGSGDCKSYSLFTAGILGALGIPFSFRYAGYVPGSAIPTHVYVVTEDESGQPIIIDAVYRAFNSQKKYDFKKDYPMNVYTLSGFDNTVNGISEDQFIGAVLTELTPSEIQRAARAIDIINKRSGVYGPEDIEDIGALKQAVKKVAAKVTKSAQKVVKVAPKVAQKAAAAVKKVANTSAKVMLAGPRGSFLLLLRGNVHSFASKVVAKKNDPRLKNIWENLGGDFKELIKNAEVGAKKKPIFGIGEPVTVALASAVPIISALAAVIGKSDAKVSPANPSSATAPPVDENAPGSGVAKLIKAATPLIKKVQAGKKAAKDIKQAAQTVAPAAKSVKSFFQGGASSSSTPSSSSSGSEGGAAFQQETPQAPEQTTGPGISPMLLLGAGALALLLLTNK